MFFQVGGPSNHHHRTGGMFTSTTQGAALELEKTKDVKGRRKRSIGFQEEKKLKAETSWWFQTFFVFTPTWGNVPI